MKTKTNVWKVVGIILIIVSSLLFLAVLGLQAETKEWDELTDDWRDLYDECFDSVVDWCEYSNEIIVYSNGISYLDTNLNLNDCS